MPPFRSLNLQERIYILESVQFEAETHAAISGICKLNEGLVSSFKFSVFENKYRKRSSEEKNKEFLWLFKRFDFRLTTVYPNKYKENSLEYCYNGYLSPETILTNVTTNNSISKLKKTA